MPSMDYLPLALRYLEVRRGTRLLYAMHLRGKSSRFLLFLHGTLT